ncbi:hypothetical protein ACRAWC_00995 [Leifsonia sp. L25]|uniref:hypothetical protein n=1 Tax=Actinomycetes TaxID=1760 RepID=UPI003D69F4E6
MYLFTCSILRFSSFWAAARTRLKKARPVVVLPDIAIIAVALRPYCATVIALGVVGAGIAAVILVFFFVWGLSTGGWRKVVCGGRLATMAHMTVDTGWRVTVPPGAAMFLHERAGSPSRLLAATGFWATLYAAPGRLRLVRGKETLLLSDIDQISTGPSDNGRGIWREALVVTSLGEKLPLMPFERRGLLPHAIEDPSSIAASIRTVVFGGDS